ncbi:unnamed protein product [Boreogadus saida]
MGVGDEGDMLLEPEWLVPCVLRLFQSLCRKAKTRFFGCAVGSDVAVKDRHNLFSGDKQNTAAARIHGIISEYPTGSLAAKSNEGTQFLGYTYTGQPTEKMSRAGLGRGEAVVVVVETVFPVLTSSTRLAGVAATSAFARSTGSYGQAAELACGSLEERVFCKASFLKAATAPRGLMMRSARRADRLGGMEVLQESRAPGEAVDYIIITLRQRHSVLTGPVKRYTAPLGARAPVAPADLLPVIEPLKPGPYLLNL